MNIAPKICNIFVSMHAGVIPTLLILKHPLGSFRIHWRLHCIIFVQL